MANYAMSFFMNGKSLSSPLIQKLTTRPPDYALVYLVDPSGTSTAQQQLKIGWGDMETWLGATGTAQESPLGGLSPTSDEFIYTLTGTYQLGQFSPLARSLVSESTAENMRAVIGAQATGTASGLTLPFSDVQALVKNNSDESKLLRFSLDGLTSGTTRTATIPDDDFTMAGIDIAQTFSQTQTFTKKPVVNVTTLFFPDVENVLDINHIFSTTPNTNGIGPAIRGLADGNEVGRVGWSLTDRGETVPTANGFLSVRSNNQEQKIIRWAAEFSGGTIQKLAFFGDDPVAQQSAISRPSGGGTIDTQARDAIDDIITTLENYNLIKT